jgi:two-component system response regulator PhoP
MAFVDQSPARALNRIPPAIPLARRTARGSQEPVRGPSPETIESTSRIPLPAAARTTISVHVVADEDDDREGLFQALAADGFRVSAFVNAATFYRAYIADRCDILVVDLMLRGEGALAIAENMRTQAGTGIVVLSRVNSTDLRLRSLECGADAYLVEPVEARELAAQMRAIHRRIACAKAPASEEPRGNWTLDEGGWVLRDPGGNEMRLTTSERALLLCLTRMHGQAVSRDEIISSLGGNPRYADPHRIDVLVNRLRQKAGAVNMTLPLHSVRCKGYALAVDAKSVPF